MLKPVQRVTTALRLARPSTGLEDFADLAAFVRVAQAQSFSRAARALDTTKATISKRLARLEARLNVQLLLRTTRHVELTEAGKSLLESATQILADVEAAESTVKSMAALPAGSLRVNTSNSFGSMHIAPITPEFLELYPRIELDLCFDDQFVDLVAGGWDVVVRVSRSSDVLASARRLARDRFVVVGSNAYFAKRGVPRTPTDLTEHVLLRYTSSPAMHRWRFDVGGKEVVLPTTPNFSSNNGGALVLAALAGVGLSRVPGFVVADHVRSGTLIEVLADFSRTEFTIDAIYPSGQRATAKVRAFIDFLAERIPPRLAMNDPRS